MSSALRGLTADGRLLFVTRFIRLFAYGALSVVLVLYLVGLGLSEAETGLLLTSTLLGDTLVSLYLTTQADRIGRRRMLIVGACLMVAAGIAFALTRQMWLLVIAGTIGVISPSGQEVGPFLPIEQAALSQVVPDRARTDVFAWYTLAGSLATALGALAAGFLTDSLQRTWAPVDSYRAIVITYACFGVALALIFFLVSPAVEAPKSIGRAADRSLFARFSGLDRSQAVVLKLAALFSLDSFGGGFVVQSFAAYWFYLRYGVDPKTLGTLFFAANVFAGISALVASRLANRIGLVNTMVVTHLPSNVLLMLIPLMPNLPLAILMLLLRFSISQMDVPTRQSYTMAVVAPEERAAASGITGVARTTGAALSPFFAGLLFMRPSLINVPFYIAGTLKIVYDLLLFRAFRSVATPEDLKRTAVVVALLAAAAGTVTAQEALPSLRAGRLPADVVIDGHLREPGWESAAAIENFLQTDPVEGAPPTTRTSVQVLADSRSIVIGIVCEETDPSRIVSFSVQRDADLESEDHVRIVLGPFADGRSGYVFAVNATGARYDALINPGGENDNADWDGIWEARTARLATGWSAEFRIPVLTIAFKPGLREWHFNVERRIERRQETNRWASPNRQYEVTQTSRAGLLTGLPDFDLGAGLTIRPAVTSGGGIPAPEVGIEGDFQPSLDVSQRIGSNILASATVNTDFAETEVDTRRTNLTRFPLFFPEKRTFFIEGDDIFSFGLGLDEDVIPYFSRRIGLVEGREVPILAGGKTNGRIGSTNFGGLAIGTRSEPDVVEDGTFMGVGRVKRNLWQESWVGALATVGDPLGRTGSWLGGGDFTYATSRFRGDKNFLVGVWGLATGRDDLGDDATAHGFKVDYPNDPIDMALTYKRIGRDFDPSIGFVPRRAVHLGGWRRPQPASVARSVSADVVRVPAVSRDRPVRALGELSCVRGADQLAPSQRRSIRIQRGANRRAPDRILRDRGRDRPPPGLVRMAALPPRSRHGAEAAVLRAGHLVVRRFLRRTARSVRMDRRMEPAADRDCRVLGRAERRTTGHRGLHADHLRHPHPPQRLARSLDRELRPVRHRQRVGGDQHPAALDVPNRCRPVRRLQPQRAIDRGPLATGLEPAADQAAVRLADVNVFDQPEEA